MPRRRRHIAQYGAHAGSAAFAPTDVSGLKGWWDFSDATKLYTDAGTTLVTADADLIAQVNDKSGQANHAVQATGANKPAYKTGIQNSLSTSRYDSTDTLRRATFTGGALSQPVAVMAVAKSTDNGVNVIVDAGAGNFQLYGNAGSWKMYAGSVITWNTTRDTASFHIFCGLFNGASSALYYEGGAAKVSGDAGAGTMVGVALSGFGGGAGGLVGDLGEVVVVSTSSLTDVNLLGAYLATKWNIAWATAV